MYKLANQSFTDMKRIVLLLTALLLVCGGASAQNNVLNRLKQRAKNAAEQNIGNKVEKGVNDLLDGKLGKNKDKDKAQNKKNEAEYDDENDSTQENAPKTGKQKKLSPEMAYAKSDFVPGDVIIFDDPMDGEKLGEFPSKWDLWEGESEVVSVNGKKAFILSKRWTKMFPLMQKSKDFLGDVFTVEFDYFWPEETPDNNVWLEMKFCLPNDNFSPCFTIGKCIGDGRLDWRWNAASSNGDVSNHGSRDDLVLSPNEWHHVALSFNKRALKVYFDGVRYINIPNVTKAPGWFWVEMGNGDEPLYLTNFRICEGAVPLYDRLASDGRIVTYAITFDTGKATLRPEAELEINRIKTLMDEDPSLNFEVQGHCDNTGSAATNDKLSQQRAEAIVARLVQLGIDESRLTAVGKGSKEPIADNSTDEGRAQNRRVEFVKIDAGGQSVARTGGGTAGVGNKAPATQIKWNAYDFVAGDQIIFEDTMEGEQLGEFPSKWDIFNGSAEIQELNGEKCICLTQCASITPLFNDNKPYLTDECTIEYDVFIRDSKTWTDQFKGDGPNAWDVHCHMETILPTANKVCEDRSGMNFYYGVISRGDEKGLNTDFNYHWHTPSDDSRSGSFALKNVKTEAWHHVAVSFNKRAFKVYFDEQRVANIPNAAKPNFVWFSADQNEYYTFFIKNVRIAKGDVPLYDRLASDGKIVTYAITFDTGKATIKPESTGEINRITKIMQEDPSIKFEIQGHCDNTGSAATNDKLSQQRAEAIMAALVANGIDASRLTAVGKGAHVPIADNATDEGRARNRRVEFIKK